MRSVPGARTGRPVPQHWPSCSSSRHRSGSRSPVSRPVSHPGGASHSIPASQGHPILEVAKPVAVTAACMRPFLVAAVMMTREIQVGNASANVSRIVGAVDLHDADHPLRIYDTVLGDDMIHADIRLIQRKGAHLLAGKRDADLAEAGMLFQEPVIVPGTVPDPPPVRSKPSIGRMMVSTSSPRPGSRSRSVRGHRTCSGQAQQSHGGTRAGGSRPL